MDEEFALHIELETRRLVEEEGLDKAEAHRRAMVAFGSVERHRDDIRNGRGVQLVEDLVADTRFALRAMRRSPVLTTVIVLTLAIAIGGTVGIFSVMHALLLKPLALPEPNELYAVQPMNGGRIDFLDISEFQAFQRNSGLTAVAAQHFSPVTVESANLREDVFADFVTPGYFEVLQAAPLLGRTFADDGSEDAAPVAVISDEMWRRHFASDPGVIGKEIRVGGVPLTVIGVMPVAYEGIHFARRFNLVMPFGTGPLVGVMNQGYGLGMITRLPTTLAAEDVERVLTRVYAECCGPNIGARSGAVRAGGRPAAQPPMYEAPFNQGDVTTPDLRPHVKLADASRGLRWSSERDFRGTYSWLLGALLAGASTLLIAACANVGALLLARSARREQEFAIRLSIGAGKSRITRQLLTESLILACLGSIAGCALAWVGIDMLTQDLPEGAERLATILRFRPSFVLMSFTSALMILATLLFGTLPAWRAGRTDPVVPLAGARAGEGGARTMRTAAGLVVLQIGMGVLLVFAASIFLQTMRNLTVPDRAVDAGHLLLTRANYDGFTPTVAGVVLGRLGDAIPGSSGLALTVDVPLIMDNIMESRVRSPGMPQSEESSSVRYNLVSAGYFSVLGIRTLEGREFTHADMAGAEEVAIVSRSFAVAHFGSQQATGRTFFEGPPESEKEVTIVGVVDDIRYDDPRVSTPPIWYRPILQNSNSFGSFAILARSSGEPDALVAPILTIMADDFPEIRVWQSRSLKAVVDETLSRERLAAALSSGFGVAASLLIAVGMYGLLTNLMQRRRREFGVRMAVGAAPSGVVGILVRQAGLLVGLGLIVGVPLAHGASRLLQSQVFGLDAADGRFILQSGAWILLAVVLATVLPGIRALRLDPATLLRGD